MIWLDLRDPDREDLAVLEAEFGLHPLAVEDAVQEHERPKLDRYRSHLFMTAYGVQLSAETGELHTSELAAFITPRALITVRKDDGLDIGAVVGLLGRQPGPGQGRRRLPAVRPDRQHRGRPLRRRAGAGRHDRGARGPAVRRRRRGTSEVQRRSFELRKSLVLLRRVVLPMREVVNALMRRDLHVVDESMQPYYQDVYDHVLRATEWTESLRDLVTTILETNLTIQGNRMNVITKKVTSWAAIIAVPTFDHRVLRDERALPGLRQPLGRGRLDRDHDRGGGPAVDHRSAATTGSDGPL